MVFCGLGVSSKYCQAVEVPFLYWRLGSAERVRQLITTSQILNNNLRSVSVSEFDLKSSLSMCSKQRSCTSVQID